MAGKPNILNSQVICIPHSNSTSILLSGEYLMDNFQEYFRENKPAKYCVFDFVWISGEVKLSRYFLGQTFPYAIQARVLSLPSIQDRDGIIYNGTYFALQIYPAELKKMAQSDKQEQQPQVQVIGASAFLGQCMILNEKQFIQLLLDFTGSRRSPQMFTTNQLINQQHKSKNIMCFEGKKYKMHKIINKQYHRIVSFLISQIFQTIKYQFKKTETSKDLGNYQQIKQQIIMSNNYIQERSELYLREHRILELFEDLCTAISYEQPQNVKEFLVEQLKNKQQQGFKTGLFSPDEVDNIYTLFDLRKEGWISKQQAKEALRTMAASQFQLQESDEALFSDKVTRQEFLELVDKILGIKTNK